MTSNRFLVGFGYCHPSWHQVEYSVLLITGLSVCLDNNRLGVACGLSRNPILEAASRRPGGLEIRDASKLITAEQTGGVVSYNLGRTWSDWVALIDWSALGRNEEACFVDCAGWQLVATRGQTWLPYLHLSTSLRNSNRSSSVQIARTHLHFYFYVFS